MANLYLVGFMGTGKSAVGRVLARKKKWQFIDLDEFIELREKRLIVDIFAEKGEPYFRRIEKKALKDVAKENKFVVACGGGIVIDPENIALMKATGRIVCLSAAPEVILARTSGQAHRPLLNVENPKERIELMMKMRAPYYAQADYLIDTSTQTVEKVVERLEKSLKPPARKAVFKKAGRKPRKRRLLKK